MTELLCIVIIFMLANIEWDVDRIKERTKQLIENSDYQRGVTTTNTNLPVQSIRKSGRRYNG
jgi:hypothetical protein